jgi:hypothetical protein
MFGKQVSRSLLATAGRTRLSSEAHILFFQMSDHQEGVLVENGYSLIKPWKDMRGHYVGGKSPYYFISCDTQLYITRPSSILIKTHPDTLETMLNPNSFNSLAYA